MLGYILRWEDVSDPQHKVTERRFKNTMKTIKQSAKGEDVTNGRDSGPRRAAEGQTAADEDMGDMKQSASRVHSEGWREFLT